MPSRTPAIPLALVVAAIGIAFSSAKLLQADALNQREAWPRVEEYRVIPPPSAAPVVYAWLGRQLAADITWARLLVYYGSSIVGESDFRYLEKFIDNVIALDPKYRRIYHWASYAVAWRNKRATVDEFRTSVRYLERAIAEFPEDWRLRQALALRYALDLDPDTEEERQRYRERAATLLEEAALLPGADINLGTIAANLRTKMGQRQRALADLRALLMATDNAAAQKKLLERYRELVEDESVQTEFAEFRESFDREWKETIPFARADLFVLLGPRPTPRVDLEAVAPIRNLLFVELGEPEPTGDSPEDSSQSETGD
ncbi:MAG: hypothetical protein KJO07_08745 [Deltaproteobacteria bacterium]|nr:hypothetical protein [Deltaproteobacteria bacterium]